MQGQHKPYKGPEQVKASCELKIERNGEKVLVQLFNVVGEGATLGFALDDAATKLYKRAKSLARLDATDLKPEAVEEREELRQLLRLPGDL